GAMLVRTRTPFAPLTLQAVPRFSDPVVLMSAPYRVSFSYAGPDGMWKENWLDSRGLPAAVRVVVRDTTTNRTLSVSTSTVIHTQLPATCISSASRGCRIATGTDASERPDAEPAGNAEGARPQ